MIRPGWQSTEFWTTFTGQLLSFLTLVGIIHASDVATLQDALAKCVTAVFVLVVNAWVVVRYIRSRTELKQTAVRNGTLVVVLLALAGLCGAAGPARAEWPRAAVCWRQAPRDDGELKLLMQQMIGLQQQTLANQQIMLALLQQQRLAPRQELPEAGRPRQELPEQGRPRQDLPEQGTPRQELPGPGQPKQELPGGRPKQDLSPMTPVPAVPSGQPLPMQRYTVVHTLCPPK
jgi:hypothetical protein